MRMQQMSPMSQRTQQNFMPKESELGIYGNGVRVIKPSAASRLGTKQMADVVMPSQKESQQQQTAIQNLPSRIMDHGLMQSYYNFRDFQTQQKVPVIQTFNLNTNSMLSFAYTNNPKPAKRVVVRDIVTPTSMPEPDTYRPMEWDDATPSDITPSLRLEQRGDLSIRSRNDMISPRLETLRE